MAPTSHPGWFKRLSERLLGRPKAKRKQAPRPTARPAVECLEDRTLLTGGSWTPLTNLAPDPSGIQTMLLLSNGTIMAQGGSDSASNNWYKLTPDSTGSYVNGSWTTLAPMSTARLFYTSDILPDGRVFVYGGEYSGPNTTDNIVNSGEIYNPLTNSWTTVTPIPGSLDPGNVFGDDPTEVIAGGKVLAGYIFDGRTFVYDPTSDTWSAGPTKLDGDRSDEEAWVKLPDGGILSYDVFDSQHSQRYEPSLNAWVDSGPVPVALETVDAELGPGFLLPDGRVFYIGGNSNTALYTPPATPTGTGSWVAGPTIPGGLGANDAPGAVEPNGDVLFAAGTTPNFSSGTAFFEYDPVANTITAVSTPPALSNDLNFTNGQVAFNTRMVELPSGQILFSDASDQLWVYTPNGAPNSAWQPTISSIARNAGGGFILTGTQLNGMSEGAAYGDDASMASNYPIVQITDGAGDVAYGRTSNWSSVGVQTGATPVTTDFTLPAGDGPGAYLATVSANGISSNGTLLLDMGNNFNNVTLQIDPNNSADVQVLENGSAVGSFALSSFTSIQAVGDANNDTLNLDFTNGNFLPSGGIHYDGATGNNTLNLLGFSPFTNEVETPTAGNAGSIVFDANAPITFTNVRTIDDTTFISGKATYNGTAAAETIDVVNFGPVNGVQATQIDSGAGGTFPTVAFAEKPKVLIQGVNGADTFTVNDSTRATGLNTLTVLAGPAAGNTFTVLATPAAVVTNVVGGGAAAAVTVGAAGGLQAIAGTLNIENNGGQNAPLVVDDSADAAARVVTLSSFSPNVNDFEGDDDVWGKISGLGPAAINYEFADSTGLTIDGGAHGNTFVVNATTPGQTTTINAGAGNDSITVNGVGANSTDDFNGQGGNDSFAVTSALASGATLNIDGGAGVNTLTGTNLGDTFNFTGTNSGADAGVVTSFANVQDLIGGTGDDTFNLNAGGGVASIDGGGGNDTLVGPNTTNTWNVTGANSGNLNATTVFTNIENLTGGTGADTFTFGANGSLLGNIDGGGLLPGPDSLDISAVVGAGFSVTGNGTNHGYAGTAAVLGGFNDIDLFTGSDTLIGTNTNNVWNITGPGSGTLIENGTFTYTFSGIAHLIGGSLTDQFNFLGGSVSTIDGGAGNNTITGDATANVWDVTGTNSGTLNTIAFTNVANLVGGSLTDQFNIQGGTVASIDGGAGTNTLTGDNVANTWNITGVDAGTLNGMAFQNIADLIGGAQADQFNVSAGGVASIDGGLGNNTLAGPNAGETWDVTGANAGSLPGLVPSFADIQNLVGGTGDDDFVFSNGATLSGAVDGGAGNDTLNVSAYTTATNAALTGLGPIDGYAGTVTGITGFTDLETLVGGPTAGATLTGLNGPATWVINGTGNYTINGSGRTFNFSGITNLTGGGGADDFIFPDGAVFAGAIDGGGGVDTLDFSAYKTAVNLTLTGLGATDGFAGSPTAITGGFTNIDNIIGSMTAAPESFTGTNLNAVWSIGVGGADSYAAGGHTLTFSNYQNLTGGTGTDNFVVAAGATSSGVLDGGAGTNTLTGPNQNATWNVTGANTGNIAGGVVSSFKNVQDLTGGTGADDFVFANGGTEALVDGGAGADTLDLSAYHTAQNVLLTGTGATDGFAGSAGAAAFTDVNTLIGSATATPQTLTGTNLNAVWTIGVGGNDTYTIGPDALAFSHYQNLTGGSGTDEFIVATGATFAGVIDGGAGNNTLVGPNQNAVWDLTGADAGDIQGVAASFKNIGTLEGGSANDDFVIHSGATLTGVLDGGGGDNTLTGPNQGEVWGVTGVNSGYLSGAISPFLNIQNLIGGSGDDDFVFSNGGAVTGFIDGGAGIDGLDFSAFATAQNVVLTGLGATDGFTGTAAGVGGGFTNISGVAGSQSSVLIGLNANSNWVLDAVSDYEADGRVLTFTSFGTVNGGSAADSFEVLGVPGPLVVNGGGGGDVFDVNDPAAITAPLIVNQGAQLTVDDSAGAAPEVATITESSVGSSPGDSLFGPGGLLRYFNMGALTFLGGPFGNTINVAATVQGAPLTVDAGAGNDAVRVYVNPYIGYSNVLIDGQGGANSLQVIDETGGAVVHNNSTGSGMGVVTAAYAEGVPSVVDYVNVAAVVTPGTANQNYVEALYHQFLHRDAAPSEVAPWAALLDATGNRALVVDALAQSAEARDVLVKQWFVSYLGRPAQNGEELPFVNELLQGQSEESVLSGILGSSEFYARGGGTESGFVQELFLATLGRPASASDVATYEQSIGPRSGPAGEAFVVLGSAEFRGDFVYALYLDELEQLERGGALSPQDVQAWVFSGLSMTGLREAFAETQEFYTSVS